jgi:chromosome partitioning protein
MSNAVSGKTIAFHSYKGGTGKTTLITNLGALYAKNGYNVGLLDFDLYAPSLVAYFRKKPSTFLNDLLNGSAAISDVLFDLSAEVSAKGKFYVAFSSPRKEDIHEIECKHDTKWQLQALKRFVAAKQELFEKYKLDFLLLDTSPGIRYWSINALASADLIFMLLKDSIMDVDGTRKMVNDIYDSLSRLGSKYYMILNKVSGGSMTSPAAQLDEAARTSELERIIDAQVVSSIPCFCDIQFNRQEYLFSTNHPEHGFSICVNKLSDTIKNLAGAPNKNA